MWRVYRGIDTTSGESQHRLGQIGEGRIAQTGCQDDVVARRAHRDAGRDRCVQNVEHFLRRLLVTLLRKAADGKQQNRENCERRGSETNSVLGFHGGLLRKQLSVVVECFKEVEASANLLRPEVEVNFLAEVWE